MRVGVMILPEARWPEAVARWRTAERLGYDTAWTYDHMWWRSLRESPWFSPLPVLTAAATATSRIRLGLLVASPNFRHPVVLAKDAIAIDDISNGRFVLGIGAGSADAGDSTVFSTRRLTSRERSERFREFADLTDQLLRTPVTNYCGRFYAADDARTIPGCVQRPRLPLAIAASGRKGLALAARYGDAWVTLGPTDFSRGYTPDECLGIVAAQVRQLEQACADAGRDGGEIDRIFIATAWAGDPLASPASCLELAQRYRAVGITHLVLHWPREAGVYAGAPDALERIAAAALPRIRDL